jgi:hypothetical protein
MRTSASAVSFVLGPFGFKLGQIRDSLCHLRTAAGAGYLESGQYVSVVNFLFP